MTTIIGSLFGVVQRCAYCLLTVTYYDYLFLVVDKTNSTYAL